jgi:cell division septal protein FtsQ
MKKALSTLFIFLLFLGAVFGIHYGLFALLDLQGMLSLKEIQVSGSSFAKKEDLVRFSGLNVGESVFEFSLKDVARNVLKHPLVEKAEVKRVLPNSVLITVTEKKAAAVVKDAKAVYLFDRNGFLLGGDHPDGGGTRPAIILDTVVPIDAGGHAEDDYLKALLKNVSDYEGAGEIREIRVKKSEGVYIVVRGCENTLFFMGKSLPDPVTMNKAVSIAAKIKKDGLKIRYIDINKENAIGYK